jgi:hypothetical protein
MATEISEITLSDRELLENIYRQQEHIIADLHDFARLRQQLQPLIAQFTSPLASAQLQSLIAQFTSPLASALTRRQRRNGNA